MGPVHPIVTQNFVARWPLALERRARRCSFATIRRRTAAPATKRTVPPTGLTWSDRPHWPERAAGDGLQVAVAQLSLAVRHAAAFAARRSPSARGPGDRVSAWLSPSGVGRDRPAPRCQVICGSTVPGRTGPIAQERGIPLVVTTGSR
jgi:hypothetical protein